MWEAKAKARPGVAHRLRLEEREGTIGGGGGGGGSWVTFVDVGESRHQLLRVKCPLRGQGDEALVTLEVGEEVGGRGPRRLEEGKWE